MMGVDGDCGVTPLETIRSMSGLQFLQKIASGELPRPPITALLGFGLAEVEDGRVTFTSEPQHRHYNPIGSVHGGFAATLLDSCMSCAVQTRLPAGRGYTTLEFKFNLVRGLTDRTGPDRTGPRRGHRHPRRLTDRYRRRPAGRCRWASLCPRHHDLPDLSDLGITVLQLTRRSRESGNLDGLRSDLSGNPPSQE